MTRKEIESNVIVAADRPLFIVTVLGNDGFNAGVTLRADDEEQAKSKAIAKFEGVTIEQLTATAERI